MGYNVVREVSAGSVPVFQNVIENAQGGFTLDTTGSDTGSVVPAGSVMGIDEATRKAKPLKVATVYEDATNVATDLKLKKGHLLIVGSVVAAVIGGKAYAVTVLDTTNAAYDVITVGTTLGVALTAGDAIFESSATGAAVAALKVTPSGLLFQDVKSGVNEPVAVVLRATVYERRIPVVPTAVKALLPNIIFSKSF